MCAVYARFAVTAMRKRFDAGYDRVERGLAIWNVDNHLSRDPPDTSREGTQVDEFLALPTNFAARIRPQLSRNDPQQQRLPRAVGSQHRPMLPVVEPPTDTVDQRLPVGLVRNVL